DQAYWWKGSGFVTLDGKTLGPAAQAQNAAVAATLASGDKAYDLPAWCAPRERAVTAGAVTVGTGRFALNPGDATGYRVS
ncbi:hypothetical protein ABTM06_20450, partial [Acinetobacter baumannii]